MPTPPGQPHSQEYDKELDNMVDDLVNGKSVNLGNNEIIKGDPEHPEQDETDII